MSKREKYNIWFGVIMLLAAGASVCFGAAFSVFLLIVTGAVFGVVAIVAFSMAAQNPSKNTSVNIPYHSDDRAKEQGKRTQAGNRISEQTRQTQTDKKTSKEQIFVGKTVWHGHFGKGIVKTTDGKYLTVSFDDGEDRKFVYPDCFMQGYLSSHDRQIEKKPQYIAAVEKKRCRKRKIQL